MAESNQESFEQASQDAKGGGLVTDFLSFMKENAKWWLLPIVLVLGLLGVLLVLASTGAAPFIYTLF